MKQLLMLVLFIASVAMLRAQDMPVGDFAQQEDIGSPRLPGTAKFDPATQTYTVAGGGYNIWFNRDEFRYVFNRIKGDFILTANFRFEGAGKNPHRKIGWMVRETPDAASAHISAVVHGDGLTTLQWRALRGAYMRDPQDEIAFAKSSPQIIQLERQGNRFIMRVAMPGEPLQWVGEKEMPDMPDEVLAGLFVCAHDSNTVERASIWNVRMDKPVGTGYDPGKSGWLGCRLETMDIASGHRMLVHSSPGRFEAPNWMPDGRHLLFNENGSLFRIPVDGGQPEKLNTGEVVRNNNDHGISFDGKWLAISSQRQGASSAVYVVPLAGGTPRMLTEQTPSYWHGWNPNGKDVLVIAQRNGSSIYNIYKVSVADGTEVPLTQNTSGHVDGSEYSPDGKYIYYNANVTGTMQIWRMRPDGSGKEQLSFDQYNNWFPHISPDGKWLLMISFPPDINPADHPSYKRVMLRLMPLSTGGGIRVLAYLYGGQGTLNVPSWSPDSKRVAFVSNSGRSD